jgi:hypothetical protein
MESMSGAQTPTPSSDARLRVRMPAVLLIITGGLGILFTVFGFLGELSGGPARSPAEEIMGNPALPDWLKTLTAISSTKSASYIMAFVTVAINAFITFGGMKMKNLESRGLALAASIIAIVPCFSCFVVGIPVGIWCLVTLSKPEVKAAFHAA